MADLYSIIVLMEHLEKAFIRDSITAEEYTPQCANLIAKYKTTMNFLSESVDSLEAFMNDYKLSCPAAVNRFNIGVPATYEHAIGDNKNDVGKQAKYIAESVLHFITLMDTLRLNRYAVDELHPILADLIQSLNNVPGLTAEFEGKQKMDQAHSEFHRLLSGDHKVDTT
ncbi:vacuolar protein sorting-associated [Mycotypha africana]|uniref:vacuolar protein sorting-associated n=1 Tax=Mycotypha africana TaxID=64632 RepID=UPI002300C1A9|nr:vacuolar protein sorting-associated [Mycotypha africana]KAI8988535.1 vacuolar protein sorting-associated [Mycotypha africana]